jgi:hypothetical protein
MGKAARHKREQRQATKSAGAAELAARAEATMAEVLCSVEADLSMLTGGKYRTTIDGPVWPEVRQATIGAGTGWP